MHARKRTVVVDSSAVRCVILVNPWGRGNGMTTHQQPHLRRPRLPVGGAATAIVVATALLFLVSWIVEPQSVRHSSLLGMLPFAAVLAIIAVGQTLVIQQGGIDLSVPGMVSLTVVIVTHYPNGDSAKLLPAILL